MVFERLKTALGLEKRPEELNLPKGDRHLHLHIQGAYPDFNPPEKQLGDLAVTIMDPILETGKLQKSITVHEAHALVFAEEYLYAHFDEKRAKAVGWVLDQAVAGSNGKEIKQMIDIVGGRGSSIGSPPTEMERAVEHSFGESFGEGKSTASRRVERQAMDKARMRIG